MKRYTIQEKYVYPPYIMTEQKDGEWVRWEDVAYVAEDLTTASKEEQCGGCYDINCFDCSKTWPILERFKEPTTPPTDPPKVFCKQCIHLGCSWSHGHGNGEGMYYCTSPSNEQDTWYAPSVQYTRTPQELNRNNDCKYFEKK